MSNSRSDQSATGKPALDEDRAAAGDPLRPDDYVGSAAGDLVQPRLDARGWLRWIWRQITSMRTALILLLILAIAAIPGSIFPQRMADPNGVTRWQSDNPELFPILDALDLFDVYLSPWFSAIYLLLFLSLIGCVIPRIAHHLKALRTPPPRTPARLSRLDDYREVSYSLADFPGRTPEHSVEVAAGQLRSLGYRIKRYDDARSFSVSAERGYWRETGNLVFHLALVGILVTIGIGGGFAYTGQRVITEGQTFVNTLLDYSSMNRGRFVSDSALAPYSMRLDRFDVTYQPYGGAASGQAGDFAANVTVNEPQSGGERPETVRVNAPLGIAGDSIYLLGNGYAPTITVRDPQGQIVFAEPVPFLPQDSQMTSLGVIKVPDGLDEQLGMIGFFYPTAATLDSGAFTSIYPDLVVPLLTLNVYSGDLGINDGTPRSVYVLDPTDMTQIVGGTSGIESIKLQPGESAELPGGRGTITFENMSPAGAEDFSKSVKRYVSLQVHHDKSAVWVLVFAVLSLAGLGLALFVPRRRMWVKATAGTESTIVEYAGLARGEDPTLAAAVEDLVARCERIMNDRDQQHESGQ